MRISYSCSRNIKTIINSHDANILFPKNNTEQRTCNCINKVIKIKQSSNQNYQKKFVLARVKPPLIKDFQITKSHLIYTNVKIKQNYQMKSGG